MSGFKNPEYTQTPNSLFDEYMRDMNGSELKVVLAIIRQTLGWHRTRARYSMGNIERLTGLSTHSVIEAVEAAEKRGLIRRIDGAMPAEWELVFEDGVQKLQGGSAKNAPLPVQKMHPLKEIKETETKPLVNLPSSCVWENSSATQAQQPEQPAPRTDATKKGDALDAYLAFGQKTTQDEFLWMPDYIRPLAQAFAEATKIYPTASERGQWIKALEVHHKRGATPSSERQAVRTSIQKSMAIKSPASVTYAIKPVEENLPRYV